MWANAEKTEALYTDMSEWSSPGRALWSLNKHCKDILHLWKTPSFVKNF